MKRDEKPARTHYDLLVLQDDGAIQIFDAERIPGMLASFGAANAIESTNKLMTEPYWDAHAKMSACLLIEREKPELPLLFHINRTYTKSRTTNFTVGTFRVGDFFAYATFDYKGVHGRITLGDMYQQQHNDYQDGYSNVIIHPDGHVAVNWT